MSKVRLSFLYLRRWRPFIPVLSRVLALIGLVVVIGLLPWLAGHDPAQALLRARSSEQEATPEALESIRTALGLADGPWKALSHWLRGLTYGDAGYSWVSGHPVLPSLLKALGVSLTLMAASLGVAFGVMVIVCGPALRKGLQGRLTRTTSSVAIALTALPEYLLVTALLLVFAIWWPLLPPFGWRGPHHVILPAVAMGIPAGGLLGRLALDRLSTVFGERWVTTWQCAGVSRIAIAWAVLRRVLPALLPQVALVVTGLTGGAIAVEKVLAIPGIGRATLGAVMAQDMPVVQMSMLMLLAVAIAVRLMAEALACVGQGKTLQQHSIPVASSLPQARSAWVWVVVAISALVVLIIMGLGRDPWGLNHTRLAPPSWALPLGADALGRDLLARLAYGALQTGGSALFVVCGCLLIGSLASLCPRALAGIIDMANALPTTVAGLVVAALYGPSPQGAVVAVMLVGWAPLAAHAIALRRELEAHPHMAMLPVLGVGPWRRLTHHVAPMMVLPLLRHAMLRLPGAALALAGLGFLGLGAQPPSPEWGVLLASSIPYMERAPWGVVAPALALILVAIMAISLTLLRPKGT